MNAAIILDTLEISLHATNLPHSYAVSRGAYSYYLFSIPPYTTNQLTIKTLVIATMLLMLVDSSIAIGLLVGVTVLSVGVFGAMAYAVASRKTKDKDSKYGHQYPVSSHGIFPGRICLEVVTLNTKLTVISNTYGTNRTNWYFFWRTSKAYYG